MICRRPAKVKVNTTGYKKLDTEFSLYPASASGIVLVPCGQCLNCRINQSRIWTNRILLESYCHSDNLFVTLTYDDNHLPSDGSLKKPHLQNYLKRLRHHVSPLHFRYFAVGEYGSLSLRPHYHLCLFGLSHIHEKQIRESWAGGDFPYCDPDIGISIGELTPASARYISGYITKKIKKIKKTHPVDLGLQDEFMISSRGTKKDGLGGIGKIAAMKVQDKLKNFDISDCDVTCLRVGPKKYPLGRYLKTFTKGDLSRKERILKFKVNQEKLFDESHKEQRKGNYSERNRRL